MNNVAEFLRSLNVNESEYALIKKAVKILERNESKTENVPWGKKRCILPSAERFQGIWNWQMSPVRFLRYRFCQWIVLHIVLSMFHRIIVRSA